MPAAVRFPRVSASNQMIGEPDFSCSPSPAGLLPRPWLRKNRGSGVVWVPLTQSVVSQVEIPCLACDLPHRAPVSALLPEIQACDPCNPGGVRELQRRAARLAESHQAAFLPAGRRRPMLRGASVCSSAGHTAPPLALLIHASARG